jgi:predicted dehydrogenase/sugar phosphate isomerase/epimerase
VILKQERFGLSTLLFRELSLENALDRIGNTRFKIIDLSIVPPEFCPHYSPLETNREDDKKLKELIEKYELKVASLNIFPGYFNKDDPRKVSLFINRCIEIANLLNAPSITLPTGIKVNSDKWLENVEVVKRHLPGLAKKASEKNVTISLETPHVGTLTETIDEAKNFHDILDCEQIKCTFDTSHVIRGERNSIADGINKIGMNKINHIHLRDAIGNDISITPGKGHGDFIDFFKVVREKKYHGYFIFELEYHDFSEKKKFEELQFAGKYCGALFHNDKIPLKLKIESHRLYQFFERFKNNPKSEIKRHEKLFLFLKKFKPIILKTLPGYVYDGKWRKAYRLKKYNVFHSKPKSVIIVKNPDKIYRIGIVGCGWAGSEMHAPGFQRLNNTEIIGGFDIDREKSNKFAKRFECSDYTSVEELVRHGKPGIVAICSREWAHYESAIYLLKNRVDVFCEKLMATRYSHAKEMVETATRHNRILAVNYNYRFMPGIRKIKEVIEQKALGGLSFFNINVHAMSYAHAIDLLSYLGGKIKSISGTFKNDDAIRIFGNTDWSLYDKDILYVPSINASVTCEFETGAVGIVNSSYFYNLNSFVLSIEAVFENGAITLNGINMFDTTGNLSFFSRQKIKKVDMNYKRGVYTRGYEYTFFSSIESFMRNYIKGKTPETPGQQGLINMEIEKMIFKSCNEKIKISLN